QLVHGSLSLSSRRSGNPQERCVGRVGCVRLGPRQPRWLSCSALRLFVVGRWNSSCSRACPLTSSSFVAPPASSLRGSGVVVSWSWRVLLVLMAATACPTVGAAVVGWPTLRRSTGRVVGDRREHGLDLERRQAGVLGHDRRDDGRHVRGGEAVAG